MGPPGGNFPVIDSGSEVGASDGNTGVVLRQQTEPAKGDFHLGRVEVIIQQTICPEERKLIHRPACCYAYMLVAVTAGILNQGQHSGFEHFKAHRGCLPAQ